MGLAPELVERFAAAAATIREPEQLRTYECDGLTGRRVVPALVVLPASAAEVQAVVRICNDAGIPFVARGAGTGLSGGALPVADGIVISLARMNRVLSIDVDAGEVVVEPGVTNLDVTRAVAADGFYYAPDPSSQQVCTIGGNVAENSGGAHCLKYGFTVNHVLAAEIVLPDGELVELSVWDEGPDLLGAVRRLRGNARDRDEADAARAGGAGSRADAARGLRAHRRRRRRRLRNDRRGHPPRRDRDDGRDHDRGGGGRRRRRLPARLRRGADRRARRTRRPGRARPRSSSEQLCREAGAVEIRIASDPADRAAVWRGRKAAFAAMGRVSPDYYVQDGVVPRTKLPEVLRRIDELSREHGLRVGNVFHAGDGNLHPLVLYDARIEGQAERAELLAEPILEACVDAGGSITGEHGVGTDKACAMPLMFSEDGPRGDEARCAAASTRPGSRTRASSSRRRGSAARCRGRTACTRSNWRALPSGSEPGIVEHEPGDLTCIVDGAASPLDAAGRARPARAAALARPARRPDARGVPARRSLRAAAPPLRDDARPRDRRRRRAAGRHARATRAARS